MEIQNTFYFFLILLKGTFSKMNFCVQKLNKWHLPHESLLIKQSPVFLIKMKLDVAFIVNARVPDLFSETLHLYYLLPAYLKIEYTINIIFLQSLTDNCQPVCLNHNKNHGSYDYVLITSAYHHEYYPNVWCTQM